MARAGQRADAVAAAETSSSDASAGQGAEATGAAQPSGPSSPQHAYENDRDVHLILAGGHLRAVPDVLEFYDRVCRDFVRDVRLAAFSSRVEVPAGLPPVPGLVFEPTNSRRAQLADATIEGILEHNLGVEICSCRLGGRREEAARLASLLWAWAAPFITRI